MLSSSLVFLAPRQLRTQNPAHHQDASREAGNVLTELPKQLVSRKIAWLAFERGHQITEIIPRKDTLLTGIFPALNFLRLKEGYHHHDYQRTLRNDAKQI